VSTAEFIFMSFWCVVLAIVLLVEGKQSYSRGFKEGGKAKEEELYKKRLLRVTRRAARAGEVVDVTSCAKGRDGSLQGSDLSSDSERERSESSLFEHDIDASGDSTAERVGGQGVSEVGGSRDVA
jgi:hypothetical protein